MIEGTSALSLNALRRRCQAWTRQAFVACFPHPFLVAESIAEQSSSFQTRVLRAEEAKRGTDRRARSGSLGGDPAAGGTLGHIFPVTKREVNRFASMITVGRAANNDIRLNVPSISKFHAYFMHVRSSDAWFIVDANSSNGTFVNGDRLGGQSPRRELANGDAIRFGVEVTTTFFGADAFFELVASSL